MEENMDKPPRQEGGVKWWEPAVEIFTQVSGWIAAPVVISLVLGKYLDSKFGTKPWIFLVLTGIAFLISIYGIVKVVGRYMKKIEEENNNDRK